MTKRSLRSLITTAALTTAALLFLSAHASMQDWKEKEKERKDDRGRNELLALPTGQYVTPTAAARRRTSSY